MFMGHLPQCRCLRTPTCCTMVAIQKRAQMELYIALSKKIDCIQTTSIRNYIVNTIEYSRTLILHATNLTTQFRQSL